VHCVLSIFACEACCEALSLSSMAVFESDIVGPAVHFTKKYNSRRRYKECISCFSASGGKPGWFF
jgi:hypothetical protein